MLLQMPLVRGGFHGRQFRRQHHDEQRRNGRGGRRSLSRRRLWRCFRSRFPQPWNVVEDLLHWREELQAVVALAVVAMLFVREIPLGGKPHLATAAEIGTEILAEEAVLPAEDEPVLVDVDGEPDTHGEAARELHRPEA